MNSTILTRLLNANIDKHYQNILSKILINRFNNNDHANNLNQNLRLLNEILFIS